MRDELNFEEKVMSMSVEIGEKQNDLTAEEFANKISENMDISFIRNVAECLDVSNEISARSALSMSLQARKIKQQLDESRREIVKPHFDYQKAINKIVKDVENKLEEIEFLLKEKIDLWDEKRKLIPFESYIDLEMKVDDGILYTQKNWNFEILDALLIPKEYLSVDEKKIKDSIQSGLRNIPGVNIFEKKEIVMRIKN